MFPLGGRVRYFRRGAGQHSFHPEPVEGSVRGAKQDRGFRGWKRRSGSSRLVPSIQCFVGTLWRAYEQVTISRKLASKLSILSVSWVMSLRHIFDTGLRRNFQVQRVFPRKQNEWSVFGGYRRDVCTEHLIEWMPEDTEVEGCSYFFLSRSFAVQIDKWWRRADVFQVRVARRSAK